jgi:hypothetical protein
MDVEPWPPADGTMRDWHLRPASPGQTVDEFVLGSYKYRRRPGIAAARDLMGEPTGKEDGAWLRTSSAR